MLVKKISITLLYLSILVSSFAQNIEVKWGPELEYTKETLFGTILYADESGFIASKLSGGSFKETMLQGYEKYRSDFTTEYFREFKSLSKGTTMQGFYWSKNGLIFNLTAYDTKTKRTDFWVQPMDKSGVLSNTKTSIILNDHFRYVFNKSNISHDRNRLAYLLHRSDPSLKDNQDIGKVITVIDENSAIVWQTPLKFQGIKSGMMRFQNMVVRNNGDVFLLCKHYDVTNPKMLKVIEVNGKSVPGYVYEVYCISNNGIDFKKIDIDVGENFITDIDMDVNTENDNIQIAGKFSTSKKFHTDGVFYQEIDRDNHPIKMIQTKFSEEFIAKFKESSGVSKAKADQVDDALSPNFTIRKVYSRPDGGAYILFEYYEKETYRASNGEYRDSYLYLDIIVTSIAPDGGMDWNLRIPKKQYYHPKYSGIIHKMYGNNLILLYNENESYFNRSDEKSKVVIDHDETFGVVRIINPQGDIETKVLLDTKETGVIMNVSKSSSTAGNDLIIFAPTRGFNNRYRLGRITIVHSGDIDPLFR
jgi:hypothetical protein